MLVAGTINKMRSEYIGDVVQYYLPVGTSEIDMNSLIGKEVRFKFMKKINCVVCGVEIRSLYAGRSMCRHCYETAPEAEECLFFPEKCKAHLGVARDMEWSKRQCLIPHYVYLAVSSGLKVGVTRHHHVPSRWIDQGAVKAVKLAETPNRHIAGVIEVFLKKYLSDKTNWKKMLESVPGDLDTDLLREKEKASEFLPLELKKYVTADNEVWDINYPLRSLPLHPKSFFPEKDIEFKGVVTGLKGQYVILNTDHTFNINRYSGFSFEIEFPG